MRIKVSHLFILIFFIGLPALASESDHSEETGTSNRPDWIEDYIYDTSQITIDVSHPLFAHATHRTQKHYLSIGVMAGNRDGSAGLLEFEGTLGQAPAGKGIWALGFGMGTNLPLSRVWSLTGKNRILGARFRSEEPDELYTGIELGVRFQPLRTVAVYVSGRADLRFQINGGQRWYRRFGGFFAAGFGLSFGFGSSS